MNWYHKYNLYVLANDEFIRLPLKTDYLESLDRERNRSLLHRFIYNIVKSIPLASILLMGIHNMTDRIFNKLTESGFTEDELNTSGIRDQIETAIIDKVKESEIEDNGVKKALEPNALSNVISGITATYYHPVPSQTDKDPFTTADGTNIKGYSFPRQKFLAVSRDLLKSKGGPLWYGDKVRVYGTDIPELKGIWEVHDTMNPRFKKKIDFLLPKGKHYPQGVWYNLTIERV